MKYLSFISLFALSSIYDHALTQEILFHPAPVHVCHASHHHVNEHMACTLNLESEPTAQISVVYNGFIPEAQAAFQYAIDIWARTISSDVPIRITANWSQLGPNVLGSASAVSTVSNFENAPQKNVRYPLALAEKLARKQLNLPTQSEISANFSSEINWYFGTDANPASDQFDMVTIVLHEIGHGLGFSGSFGANGQIAAWGLDNTGQTGIPIIYDLYLQDPLGRLLINETIYPNNSAELLSAVTSNGVKFGSPIARRVFGTFPPIFSPDPWNGGSSISHLDEAVFPPGNESSLMSPQLGLGEAIHNPGSITNSIFAEIGWVHTFLSHTELLFVEDLNNPVAFELTIESDSAVDVENAELIISEDSFNSSLTFSLAETSDPLVYSVDISPGDLPTSFDYYFKYISPEDRTYLSPSDGINHPFSATVAVDTELPTISHDPFGFIPDNEFEIEFLVNDNFGIDSVYLEYRKLIDSESNFLGVDRSLIESNPLTIRLTKSEFAFEDLDTLYYKIHAIDRSINQNSRTFPEESFLQAIAITPRSALESIKLDLESNQISDSIALNNLSISEETNFSSQSIRSDHPYRNGLDGYSSFILRHPVVLTTNTFLSFDVIALLEPRNDDELNDYLIIEGSSDLGKSWHAIDGPLDASSYLEWTSVFSSDTDSEGSNAIGNETLFRNRTVNLIQEGLPFLPGNEILIRFSLITNDSFNGWGFDMDNIVIDRSTVTSVAEQKVDIRIYPNPASDMIRMVGLSGNHQIEIRDLSGRTVYSDTHRSRSPIVMADWKSGIYILTVLNSAGAVTFQQKFIKE